MATNWSMKEAAKAIVAGNKEAMLDIGRRFPLTAIAIAKMGNNEGAMAIIGALPDHISARKIESVLKDGIQESDEDMNEEEVEVKEEKPVKKAPVKKAPAKKKEEPAMNEPEDNDEEDYESMSEVDLFKLCKKKGLKPAPKQNKDYYLDLLNPSDDNEDEEDWDEEEKPAKKAPTKKEAKKPAKKAAKKEDSDDDDDDWDI